MSKNRIIALCLASAIVITAIVFYPKPPPAAVKDYVTESQLLAALANKPEPEPAPVTTTANPQSNSSSADTHATYIICAPLITSANADIQATSSLSVVSQAVKGTEDLSGGVQNNLAGNDPSQSSGESESGVNPSSYICTEDRYNCSDFATQAEAQAAFEACGGTSNDVHKLDRDKDGRVCVSL